MPEPLRISPQARRQDVQGLRALAVVAVVAQHASGWPRGGFVGVDVFFVVSGFLITGLLVREAEQTGRVSFAGFYRRRARRILPAALLVLAFTLLTAHALVPAAREREIATDAGWSALFAANLRFLSLGTNYFTADGPPSPVQHYWSLGVEEQFYVVWPVVLVAAVVLARRTRRSFGAVTAGVVGILTVASLGWALERSASAPTSAYFSTASRAWELGAGALLALTPIPMPRAVRGPLAWIGLAAILGDLLLAGSWGAVPAPAVLPGVLGTALILAARAPAATLPPLTNPVAVRIGNWSYSLYLWHLPVLVLGALVLPPGTASTLLLLAVAVLLAVVGYHFVERPFHLGMGTLRRRIGAAAAAVLLCSVGAAAAVTRPPAIEPLAGPARTAGAQPAAPAGTSRGPSPATATASPPSTPLPSLTGAIREALHATSWPPLHPDVPAVGIDASRVPEWTRSGCLVVTRHNEHHCRWAPAHPTRTAVVVGDSIAVSWLPTVRAALEPRGWAVQALTMAQCPAADVRVTDVSGSTAFAATCAAHNAWALARIRAMHPVLILASSASSSELRMIGGADSAVWRTGQAALLERMPAAAHVVLVDPPPREASLLECDTRGSTPAACVAAPPQYDARFRADERIAAATVAHATHVATLDWFCIASRCPAFVGDDAVFADGEHLTEPYAKRLGPVLAHALAGITG